MFMEELRADILEFERERKRERVCVCGSTFVCFCIAVALRSHEMMGQRKVSSTFNVMCNRLVHSVHTLTFSPALYPIISDYGNGEKEKKN